MHMRKSHFVFLRNLAGAFFFLRLKHLQCLFIPVSNQIDTFFLVGRTHTFGVAGVDSPSKPLYDGVEVLQARQHLPRREKNTHKHFARAYPI